MAYTDEIMRSEHSVIVGLRISLASCEWSSVLVNWWPITWDLSCAPRVWPTGLPAVGHQLGQSSLKHILIMSCQVEPKLRSRGERSTHKPKSMNNPYMNRQLQYIRCKKNDMKLYARFVALNELSHIKGTVSWDLWHIFYLMNRQKRVHKLFHFAKIFDCKVRKSLVRIVNDYCTSVQCTVGE